MVSSELDYRPTALWLELEQKVQHVYFKHSLRVSGRLSVTHEGSVASHVNKP